MAKVQNRSKATNGGNSSAKGGKTIPITMFLVDTGEKFHLKDVTYSMTIKELKSYLEFSTGIPVFLQRLHYLDEGEFACFRFNFSVSKEIVA